ncbi:MAG: DUF3622 domain-containing protein [Aquificae bacterium]|nr:DUF3622 domain-containing protein [Aquificota bacterium]
MFITIDDNTIINLENVKSIKLKYVIGQYHWAFYLDPLALDEPFLNFTISEHSKGFNTEQEAINWFKKEIEPYIEKYNKRREI